MWVKRLFVLTFSLFYLRQSTIFVRVNKHRLTLFVSFASFVVIGSLTVVSVSNCSFRLHKFDSSVWICLLWIRILECVFPLAKNEKSISWILWKFHVLCCYVSGVRRHDCNYRLHYFTWSFVQAMFISLIMNDPQSSYHRDWRLHFSRVHLCGVCEHVTRRTKNLCASAPDIPNIFLFPLSLIEFPISCVCDSISQDTRLLNIMNGQHTLRQQEATQSVSKLWWHFGAIYFIMTIPFNFRDVSENQL